MAIIKALSPEYIRQHSDLIAAASLVFLDANLPPATIRTIVSLAAARQSAAVRRSGSHCPGPAFAALPEPLLYGDPQPQRGHPPH